MSISNEPRLVYPKQSGPHYQLYGHDTIKGLATDADLEKKLRYSSVRGGEQAHSIREGVHWYDYNVSGDAFNEHGTKVYRLEEFVPANDGTNILKGQRLMEQNGIVKKENYVSHCGGFGTDSEPLSSLQIYDRESGATTVLRKKGNEIIGGYEIVPKSNALKEGFAGKIQKFALKIGTNPKTGCERPVLRRIAGFMFDMAKKIK